MTNWIKFETTTPDKPEVAIIADTLKIDPDEAVGKLLRIWIWADANCADGEPIAVPDSFIDRLARKRGFARAMRKAGWLAVTQGALHFPNFQRHNGVTAKARAVTARRVTKHRERNAASVTNVTPEPLTTPLPEEDIDKSTFPPLNPPPSPGEDFFPSDRPPPAGQHAATAERIVGLYPRRERAHEAIVEVIAQLRRAKDPAALATQMADGTEAAAKVIRAMPSGALNARVPSTLNFFKDRRYADDPGALSRVAGPNGATQSAPLNLGGRKPAEVIHLPQP